MASFCAKKFVKFVEWPFLQRRFPPIEAPFFVGCNARRALVPQWRVGNEGEVHGQGTRQRDGTRLFRRTLLPPGIRAVAGGGSAGGEVCCVVAVQLHAEQSCEQHRFVGNVS